MRDAGRKEGVLTENQFVTSELVAVIERIVFHGLKNPDTFKGSTPHFWYWIERVSETELSIKPGKECLALRTSRGRCRSWLRVMINENHLASALRTLFKSGNGLEIQLWYEQWSVFRMETSRNRIMTQLERLSAYSFELTSAYDEVLDVSEPGEITKVNSRVITTSSKSEEEDVIVKKKERPPSFRLGDLKVQNDDDDDDDDDDDVPPLRRSVSRIQDENLFSNITTTSVTSPSSSIPVADKTKSRIVVKGAGLDVVNGTYVETGTKNGAVRYVYNELEIFRFRVPNTETFRWYLGNPERKIVYYFTEGNENDRRISKHTTWFAHSDAPHPPPSSVVDPVTTTTTSYDEDERPVRIKRKRRHKRSPGLSPIKFPETPEQRPPGLSLQAEEQESEFAISLRVAMLRLENRPDDGTPLAVSNLKTNQTIATSPSLAETSNNEENVWERVSDEGGSGASYYYNTRTGKTTWKRPPSMRRSPTTVSTNISSTKSVTTTPSTKVSSKAWHAFAEDRRSERAYLAFVEKRRELSDEIETLRKRIIETEREVLLEQKQQEKMDDEKDTLRSEEWTARLERGDGMSVQRLSVVSASIVEKPTKHVKYNVRVDAVVEEDQTRRRRVQWNVRGGF